MTTYPTYTPGDKVADLTFEPYLRGVIVAKHETRADAYHVQLDGGVNTVIIHARNLRKN